MSANTNAVTEKRIKVLNDFYDIKGDGIAHAKIGQLRSSAKFRDSVNRLVEANLLGKKDKR